MSNNAAVEALEIQRDTLRTQADMGALALSALGQLYEADPSGALESAQALYVATSLFLGADPQMASLMSALLAKKLEDSGIAQWHQEKVAQLTEIEAAIAALQGDQ